MAFFYRFVAVPMDMENFASPVPGKLTPYTAVFVFDMGVFVSNFLRGVIWCIDQYFSMIVPEKMGAPVIFNRLNVGMFILFVIGLGFLIYVGA